MWIIDKMRNDVTPFPSLNIKKVFVYFCTTVNNIYRCTVYFSHEEDEHFYTEQQCYQF